MVQNAAAEDTPAALIAHAREMASAGRALEAIDLLSAANRTAASADIEIELVRQRSVAFDELRRAARPRRRENKPVAGGLCGSPKMAAASISAERIRAAIDAFGYAHVTGAASAGECEALREDVDRAFSARDGRDTGCLSDYRAFDAAAGAFPGKRDRPMRIWVADAPRLLFAYSEFVARSGLGDVIQEFLGERPAISVNKTSARRVRPYPTEAGWHQDGKFLGRSIHTLNVWLALSDCGEAAPGMEILPRRLDHIVETGTPGAPLDWTVAPDKVLEAGDGVLPETPEVTAGDMFLFDHYFLHRTNSRAPGGGTRYAIECWYFAPSAYPEKGQFPLAF